MATRKFALHIVSHTRWPREGRQTFQQTRLELVDLIDRLLERLQTQTRHPGIMLDGQAILAEDYLTIRPDRLDVIQALASEGRLHIGPWYVAPEPFLVSPEAIIRNLMLGMDTAFRLAGDPLRVSYLPDASGQFGQMPQILRGFGIESAVVQRGAGDAASELWWEAPDGSRVLLIHLREGYANAAELPVEHKALKAALITARDNLKDNSTTDSLLLMNGADYTAPQVDTLEGMNSQGQLNRSTQFIVSTLTDYIEAVLNAAPDLPLIVGEFRTAQRVPILAGTMSARMGLKQHNHAVQTQLERWAEPFGAWASLAAEGATHSGEPSNLPPKSHMASLTHAWRILLQNHAQESIRGTGIDQVHKEMETRFAHAAQIASSITERSLTYLADHTATDSIPVNDPLLTLVVFNAAGHNNSDLASGDITIPAEWPDFDLIDDRGTPLPYELIPARDEAFADDAPSHRLQFVAQDVPAYGYRTFALQPVEAHAETDYVTDEGSTIENDFLRITVDAEDGTWTLEDKRTGRSYPSLNQVVDSGDCGDAYTYCRPERDMALSIPTNAPLRIRRFTGPVTQMLEILEIFRLPQSLTKDRTARLPLTAQFLPMPIVTRVRLTQGLARVDVEVEVTNSAKDHRLQVHFPTGIAAQEALFDGHFEITERPIALPGRKQTKLWAEQPVPEHPQRAFVTVLGDDCGLTIANRGLPESSLLTDQAGNAEIALTLLRSVGWLIRSDLPVRRNTSSLMLEAPGAQCQGEYTFSYALIPHDGDPLPAWQDAWAFQTPLRIIPTGQHAGHLPSSDSLITSSNPALVLSSIKQAADGEALIVRGYNISTEPQQVALRPTEGFTYCEFARMDESGTGVTRKVRKNGTIVFEAQPAEIVTLRLYR